MHTLTSYHIFLFLPRNDTQWIWDASLVKIIASLAPKCKLLRDFCLGLEGGWGVRTSLWNSGLKTNIVSECCLSLLASWILTKYHPLVTSQKSHFGSMTVPTQVPLVGESPRAVMEKCGQGICGRKVILWLCEFLPKFTTNMFRIFNSLWLWRYENMWKEGDGVGQRGE